MECGEHQSTKPQKPSSRKAPKSQAPNQGPSDVVAIQGGGLRFGAWNFTGPSSAVAACRILPQRHVCYGGLEVWSLGFIPPKTARNHVPRVGVPDQSFHRRHQKG
jgi:hypothetical protein